MPLPKDPVKRELYLEDLKKRMLEYGNDPEEKKRRSERAKKQWSDPEKRKARTDLLIKRYEDPNERIKTGNAMKGHGCSEETRKKIGDSHRGEKNPWYGKHLPVEVRQKMSNARKGENHPMWKGGISYGQYCPKFNEEFKERVRAFFGYVCPECGTPQTDVKLAVHHVNYHKGMCCDPTVPHLFIPLCAASKKTKGNTSCHSLTNWNREYWQEYFTDIIMNYYGGKCYLTREEMESLFGKRVPVRSRLDKV